MLRKRVIVLLALLATLLPESVKAVAVPFLGWGYSVGYGIGWVAGSKAHREGHAWSTLFDPPADIVRGQATFRYDPALITIIPESSGFIGPFSDDPATAIPFEPSGFYGDMSTRTLGSPRPGMISNLIIGTDTVVLQFDLSANPITVESESAHVNFFILALETSQPLLGFELQPTATGQFFEVGSPADQSQTFMICRDARGEYSCGATTALGLIAVAVPEPSSFLLLAAAAVCACGIVRCRRRTDS